MAVTRVTISRRMRKVVEIKLKPSCLNKGYLLLIPTERGVYAGEGVVKNTNNTCRVMVINIQERVELIEINPQEIHPFEYYSPFEETSVDEDELVTLTDTEERYNRLKELIHS